MNDELRATKRRIADELARKLYPQLFETTAKTDAICRHCGEPESHHTTWPVKLEWEESNESDR